MMKNVNYNLIKLLHCKLDAIWRLEKFYCDDAAREKCHSEGALRQILEDEKRHVKMIKEEIKKRIEAGLFD